MSTARSIRYIMTMADRYAKAKAEKRKPSDVQYLREQLKTALVPIVSAAELAKLAIEKEHQ